MLFTIKRILLIFSIMILAALMVRAQPADFHGHWDDDYSYTLPVFSWITFRKVDQARLWAEYPAPKFNAYVDFYIPFGSGSKAARYREINMGPAFDVSAGVKFTRWFYAGILTGVAAPEYKSIALIDNMTGVSESVRLSHVPLALDIRGIWPLGNAVQPFVEAAPGMFWGISDIKGTYGFYFRGGLGVEITRVTVSAGYNCLLNHGNPIRLGYVKLGLRIGR